VNDGKLININIKAGDQTLSTKPSKTNQFKEEFTLSELPTSTKSLELQVIINNAQDSHVTIELSTLVLGNKNTLTTQLTKSDNSAAGTIVWW